jgi:hypothetical protein
MEWEEILELSVEILVCEGAKFLRGFELSLGGKFKGTLSSGSSCLIFCC